MTHTTIRLNAEKKEEFIKVCDDMGLSFSGAINLFVTKVLQCRKIPFEITADFMDDTDEIHTYRA